MPVVHVRMDNRLIHGQILVSWNAEFKIDHIIVTNDKVAADALQVTLLSVFEQDQEFSFGNSSVSKSGKEISGPVSVLLVDIGDSPPDCDQFLIISKRLGAFFGTSP